MNARDKDGLTWPAPHGIKVRQIVTQFLATPDTELEAVFRTITSDDFKNLLSFFRGSPEYDVVENPRRLDVSMPEFQRGRNEVRTRVTMTDKATMNAFVGSGTPPAPRSATVQEKVTLQKLKLPDEGFRINLKEERDVFDRTPAEVLRTTRVPPPIRTYRLLRRFSVLSTDRVHRFDLSMVNSAASALPLFKNVPADAFQEAFEVEVECVDKARTAPEIEASLRRCIATITAVVAPLFEGGRVLDEMAKLTGHRGFVGPDLVTLDKINMLEPDYDIVSVRNGDYLVTEKADGERTLLFVDAERRVHAVGGGAMLSVTTVGAARTLGSCLLDCERVRGGEFLVFDAYFDGGANVAGRPLQAEAGHGDRLTAARHVVDDLELGEGFRVRMKLYRDEADACALLRDFKLGRVGDYEIDGLVYMPRSLPVGAYPGGEQSLAKARWVRAFKWKPPEKNTVDFRVALDAATGVLTLHVGHSSHSDPVRPLDYLTGRPRPRREYGERPFAPAPTCVVEADARTGRFLCADGDAIRDGDVVEFRYDVAAGRWRPERKRRDKQRGNNSETAANVWASIHSPLLEEHVCGTLEIKESKEALLDDKYSMRELPREKLPTFRMLRYHNWLKERLIATACELAARSSADADQGQRPAPGRARQGAALKLLDLACGKAPDLNKWERHGVVAAVGVDGSTDSIVNGKDGAYARMYEEDAKPAHHGREPAAGGGKLRKRAVFAAYDLSRPLTAEAFSAAAAAAPAPTGAGEGEGEGDVDEQMTQVLLATWAPEHPRAARGLAPKLRGLAAGGFDVVTCMFAIHYFFRDERTLDTFLDNVSANLRPGGVFAGCCFDGPTVELALRKAAADSAVATTTPRLTGRLEDGQRVAWVVEATETTFAAAAAPAAAGAKRKNKVNKVEAPAEQQHQRKPFGREIKVYIDALNHKMSEFLVDLDVLHQKALARGLVLLDFEFDKREQERQLLPRATGMFADALTGYESSVDKDNKLSDIERQYSSFNRWFLFQKEVERGADN